MRHEQLQAEVDRNRESYMTETRLRHAAEGRQQASEEAARDASERHRAQAQQLESDLKAASEEVVEARREAASAQARLEQVESILHDPAHSERLNRLEVSLEQAKRRVSELEVQLASVRSSSSVCLHHTLNERFNNTLSSGGEIPDLSDCLIVYPNTNSSLYAIRILNCRGDASDTSVNLYSLTVIPTCYNLTPHANFG